ncbi:hypothetical protein KB206_00205 [Microvirga sp. STS02]|uniref:hypothetical protein n=1 Tax=Hymenobacter negativus TaxID=2795026 RepID=UPI0018DB90E8|nr:MULTISPECIES: hypothetical protein [Bacteria]MBH8567287.1 hypothetical protein [Hymenobacter negativus]MBR7207019.1 hypothetical protein [Microvirga sp. STS02]
MRQLFAFVLLMFVAVGCKKEPDPVKDEIVLNQPVLQGDSIVLTWSKPANPDHTRYQIRRGTAPIGSFFDLTLVGDGAIPFLDDNRYVDNTAAYCPYLTYTVVGIRQNSLGVYSSSAGGSNTVIFERPNLKTIHAEPFDVQFDAQRRLLYFFDKKGVITQYSLTTNAITKVITTAATIGYCDRTTYNGVPEIYVPRADGWVLVYNALTLDKIDEINVGANASSVVANQGLLFVSVDDPAGHPLKVYSRATKQLVSAASGRKITRLKMLPNSNTKLVGISDGYDSVQRLSLNDLQYFTFSSTGLPTANTAIPFDGTQLMTPGIFEVCPTNNTIITSREGNIYNENLQFQGKLLRGTANYTSFAYDPTGRFIYAGASTISVGWKQRVDVYDAANQTLSRSITTKAYPFRLFADGTNGIVVVSSISVVATNDRTSPVTDMVVEYFK